MRLALLVTLLLAPGAAAADQASEGLELLALRAATGVEDRKPTGVATRFDLDVRPGDPWDPNQLRREFDRFWGRGYFSDLRFLGRCDPEGAVLIIELEERLADHLGTKVKIDYGKRGGKVTVRFSSLDDLERIYRSFFG